MKNTVKPFLLITPLLGLFTASCGDNFSTPKDAGPFCYYAGIRYAPPQSWTAKDGIHICTCGFEGEVLCSGPDTGSPDVSRDASGDQFVPSDTLSDGDTALVPVEARDAAPADIPVGSDGKVDAPAVDSSTGDGRLAAERD
jgi:hypothetical protein